MWRKAYDPCELKIKFGMGNRDILVIVAARGFFPPFVVNLSCWEKNDMMTVNYN